MHWKEREKKKKEKAVSLMVIGICNCELVFKRKCSQWITVEKKMKGKVNEKLVWVNYKKKKEKKSQEGW